jgi:hypothetical protein
MTGEAIVAMAMAAAIGLVAVYWRVRRAEIRRLSGKGARAALVDATREWSRVRAWGRAGNAGERKSHE